uniref:flocculation protein FLO11-like n=1 Tax=Styela clava TaxID=7725 RepID=UPI00193A7F2B|nr:flocculation protein FLO11-like [Styela clava]
MTSLSIFGRVDLVNETYSLSYSSEFSEEWNATLSLITEAYSAMNITYNELTIIEIENDAEIPLIFYEMKVKDKSLPSPVNYKLTGESFNNSFINNGDECVGTPRIYVEIMGHGTTEYTFAYHFNSSYPVTRDNVDIHMYITQEDRSTITIPVIYAGEMFDDGPQTSINIQANGVITPGSSNDEIATLNLNTVAGLTPGFLIKDVLKGSGVKLYTRYFSAQNLSSTANTVDHLFHSTELNASVVNETAEAITYTSSSDGTSVTLNIPSLEKTIRYEILDDSGTVVATLEEEDIDGSDILKIPIASMTNGTEVTLELNIMTRLQDDQTALATSSYEIRVTPTATTESDTTTAATSQPSTTVAEPTTAATSQPSTTIAEPTTVATTQPSIAITEPTTAATPQPSTTIAEPTTAATSQPSTTIAEPTTAATSQPSTTIAEPTTAATSQPSTTIAEPTTAATSQPSTTIAEPTTAATSQPSTTIAEPTTAATSQPSTTIAEPTTAATSQPSPTIAEPTTAATSQPSTTITEPTTTETPQPPTTITEPTTAETPQPSTTITEPTTAATFQPSTTSSEPSTAETSQPSTTIAEPTTAATSQPPTTITEPTTAATSQSSTTSFEPTTAVTSQPSTASSEPSTAETSQPSTTITEPTTAITSQPCTAITEATPTTAKPATDSIVSTTVSESSTTTINSQPVLPVWGLILIIVIGIGLLGVPIYFIARHFDNKQNDQEKPSVEMWNVNGNHNRWDPELRITPEEALRHPFITGQSSENELEEYPILIQRFIGKI